MNLLIFYEVVAALSNCLHALEHDCWRLLSGSVRLGYFTLWVTIWIIIWLNHGVYVSKIIPISKCISLYIQCNVEGSILIASLEDDTTKGCLLDDKRLCPKFFLGNCVPHFFTIYWKETVSCFSSFLCIYSALEIIYCRCHTFYVDYNVF